MSRQDQYGGPDVRDPQQRPEAFAGPSQRLAEKRAEAIGKTTLLPVCSFKQIEDKPKEADRG